MSGNIEPRDPGDIADEDWKRHKEEGLPLPGYPDTETVEQTAERLAQEHQVLLARLAVSERDDRIKVLEAQCAEATEFIAKLKAEREEAAELVRDIGKATRAGMWPSCIMERYSSFLAKHQGGGGGS